MTEIKPKEISLYVSCQLYHNLNDTRPITFKDKFGTIENVARQYGIKIERMNNCYKFSAPKSRLQIFAEKLHFSRVSYSFKEYEKRP